MNYQNKLWELIKSLETRPKILLHSCCGPCSTAVIDLLKDYFDVTIYYYNPNIEPNEEYIKRKNEQIRFINELNNEFVHFMDCDYENEVFREKTKGFEKEPENGARCSICYKIRMEKTAKEGKKLNFDYFGTTLTVSPYKNSQKINEIGAYLEKKYEIKFLYSDFKKKDGYKKSIELSNKYKLYRQNYCGCEFGRDKDV